MLPQFSPCIHRPHRRTHANWMKQTDYIPIAMYFESIFGLFVYFWLNVSAVDKKKEQKKKTKQKS